jgi:hypothetical protein
MPPHRQRETSGVIPCATDATLFRWRWCHWSHRMTQVGFRAHRLIEVMRKIVN